MVNRKLIDISITVALDSTTSEVLPQAVEAGLQNPREFEEFGVIYGAVANKSIMNDIRDIAGVIAVQKQVTTWGATEQI